MMLNPILYDRNVECNMPSSDTTVRSTSNAMSHISACVLRSYHGPVDKCETHSLNVCQSECTQGIHMQFNTATIFAKLQTICNNRRTLTTNRFKNYIRIELLKKPPPSASSSSSSSSMDPPTLAQVPQLVTTEHLHLSAVI